MGANDDEQASRPAKSRRSPEFDATLPAEDHGSPGSGERPATDLAPGRTIGRYVLGETLGSGGMGVVYRARDPDLDRELAIKVVLPPLASRRSHERLLSEARAMAKLRHPAVVPVFDVGITDRGVHVVMPMVGGGTLHDWLTARRRPWGEVVARFVSAGRGLAAAHAVGIVHRDFKPRNVLLDEHGAVMVADFGLADDTALASVLGDALASGVVGTPAYMAPEQAAGITVDARADQYSFCISLWEGLHGHRPTGDDDPATAVIAGDVPTWLQLIVARGFAKDPDHRWPSMVALLDQIDVQMRPRRSRLRRFGPWLAAGGLLVLAATVVALSVGSTDRRGPAPDACTGFEAQLAGGWDPAVRQDLERAFGALTAPRAAEIARRVSSTLDQRARAWVDARIAVCRAAVRGEVSPEVAQARITCLDRRRDELAGLARLLVNADDKLVPRAISAAEETGRVAGCAHEVAGRRDGDSGDPRLAAVRARANEVSLLRKVGRVNEAIAALPAVIDEALEVGALSLAAQALLDLAAAQTGTDPDAAAATLTRATRLAGEAHDDTLVAQCLIYAIFLTGNVQKRFDEALALRPSTEAAIARAGSTPTLRYGFHHNVGQILAAADRNDEAWTELTAALSLAESPHGPSSTSLIVTLIALGTVAEQRGDIEASRQMYERAVTAIEQRDGSDAPLVAYPINNLGMIAYRQGRHEDALALYQRAHALFEAHLPPGSPQIGASAMNVATQLELVGRRTEALPLYQRSLAIRETTFGADHPDVAQTLVNFGTFHSSGGRLAEGRAMLERAVAIRRKALGPDHLLLASALTNLALIAVDSGASGDGVTAGTEALAIFDRSGRREHPQVVETLIALARAHLARNAPRRAIPLLDRALALQPRPPPELWGQAAFLAARAAWESGGDKVRALALAREAHTALLTAGVAAERWTGVASAWIAEHDPQRH